MAAQSNKKLDVYNWIIKIINSCKNHNQINSVNRLITNFRDKYEDWELTKSLRNFAHHREFK